MKRPPHRTGIQNLRLGLTEIERMFRVRKLTTADQGLVAPVVVAAVAWSVAAGQRRHRWVSDVPFPFL